MIATGRPGRRALPVSGASSRIFLVPIAPLGLLVAGGGEVATLSMIDATSGQRIEIASALDLTQWEWALLVLAYLAPLVLAAAILARPRLRGE